MYVFVFSPFSLFLESKVEVEVWIVAVSRNTVENIFQPTLEAEVNKKMSL